MSEATNLSTEQAMKMLYERNEQLAKELQALRMEQQQALIRLGSNHKTKGLKPPQPDVFRGQSVDTFLFTIEKIFDFYEIEESNKVCTAVNYFRDAALRWFKFMEREFQQSPPSWTHFKSLLIQHFKAANTETIIRNRLNNLRQIGSVIGYNDAFNKLIIELPDIDENTKIDMYCRGLKQQVQLHVRLRAPESLNIAQSVAMNVDNIIGTTTFGKPKSFNTTSRFSNADTPSSSNSAPMELGNTQQDREQEDADTELSAISGRYRGSHKLSKDELQQLMREKKCFKCKETGHMARRCPNFLKKNF